MGFCTRRHFFLVICVLQMIATIERQIFDFLGYMWAPILANFFQIIFVIFGFFGAYQYRSKYIIAFCVWSIIWIGWNIFIICFYLNVGILDKEGDALNFGTSSVSWWEVNGAGCKPSYASPPVTSTSRPTIPSFSTDSDGGTLETVLSSHVTLDPVDEFAPYRPLRPTSISGCLLSYEHVEVLHAAINCLLAVLATSSGICLIHGLMGEDDNFTFAGGFGPASPSSYYYATPRLSTPSLTLLPSPLGSPRSPSPSTPRVLLNQRRERARQERPMSANYVSLGEGFMLGAFGAEDSPYSERKGLMVSPSHHPANVHEARPGRNYRRRQHRNPSKSRPNSTRAGKTRTASSLYSIEYSTHPHSLGRSTTPDTLGDEGQGLPIIPGEAPPAFPYASTSSNHNGSNGIGINPLSRPMTPRRVKRRSVTRTSTRHNPVRHSSRSIGSGTAARAAAAATASLRASLRSTRTGSSHKNPVVRLIDHPRGICPPGDSSSTEESTGRLAFGHTLLLPQPRIHVSAGGHSNPTYQSSQPGSTLSLDADSNRPPSARSSYSNYHGQRRQPVAGLGAGRATGQVPVGNTSTFSNHRSSQASSIGNYGYESTSVYNHALDSETVI